MPHECTNCGKVFPDGSKEMLSGCPDCGGNKFQFRPSGASGSGGDARSTGDRTGTTGGSTDASSETASDRRSSRRSEAAEGGGSESPTWQRTAERATETESQTEDAPRRSTSTDARADSGNAGASQSGASRSDAPRSDASSSEVSRDDQPRGLSGRAADAGRTVRDWMNGGNSNDAADEASASADARSDDATSEPSDSPGDADPSGAPEAPAREDSAQASARTDVVSPDEIEAAASHAAVDDADTPPTDADGTVIEPEDDDRPDLADLREELNNQFESIKIVRPGEYELNLMELYDRNEYIISLREDGRYVIEVPDAWGDRGPDEE
jgi:hypothetical protein